MNTLLPFEKIDSASQVIEKYLDVTGCLPGISYYSSSLRLIMGQIQLVSAIGLACIFTLSDLLIFNQIPKRQDVQYKKCIEYALHGGLNILGSIAESSIVLKLPLVIYRLIGLKILNYNELDKFTIRAGHVHYYSLKFYHWVAR